MQMITKKDNKIYKNLQEEAILRTHCKRGYSRQNGNVGECQIISNEKFFSFQETVERL